MRIKNKILEKKNEVWWGFRNDLISIQKIYTLRSKAEVLKTFEVKDGILNSKCIIIYSFYL